MISDTVDELTPVVGTRPACRALSAAERRAVLDVLHCERFVDCSPAQVNATLLDEGRYLASEGTMYRLLAARHGGVRERRDQLTHPAYVQPELLTERPNELWSWDVSKLLGPAKWTYFYLYVILDVFSRYVVGWTVQHRETGPIAEALIVQSVEQQQIEPGTLTVHADRGAAQRSKPVAFLLADLGITKTHSRPLHLDRHPLLAGALQDAQVPPRVPRAARLDRAGARLLPRVLPLVQPPAPPLRNRPDDPGSRPPRARAAALRPARRRPRRRVHAQPRAIRPTATRPPALPAAAWINKPETKEVAHENPTTQRLTELDRLRVTWPGDAPLVRARAAGRLPHPVHVLLNRTRPRFVRNDAAAVPLNTWLIVEPASGVDPDELFPALEQPEVATQLERGARVYGGGLWKLEPSELADIRLPSGRCAAAQLPLDLESEPRSV